MISLFSYCLSGKGPHPFKSLNPLFESSDFFFVFPNPCFKNLTPVCSNFQSSILSISKSNYVPRDKYNIPTDGALGHWSEEMQWNPHRSCSGDSNRRKTRKHQKIRWLTEIMVRRKEELVNMTAITHYPVGKAYLSVVAIDLCLIMRSPLNLVTIQQNLLQNPIQWRPHNGAQA